MSVLVEIGTEEIPSRFVSSILSNIKQNLIKELEKNNILIDENIIETHSTYRRLIIHIKSVPSSVKIEKQRLNGPILSIAKDSDGSWTKAAIGFAKKSGGSTNDIKISKDQKDREIIIIETPEKTINTLSILSNSIPNAITSINLPIAMRWGTHKEHFIRPIHWILALFNTTIIPFKLFDIESSNKSFGHRFLSSSSSSINGKEITINNSSDLISKLENENVIACSKKRQSIIESTLNKYYENKDYDKALLKEVIHLVEKPTPLIGSFPEKYLDLPPEVLIESMKKHQRYFPIYNNDQLTNKFLLIADNVTKSNQQSIINGNQKVLTARLEDALFFYNEDQKNTLESYNKNLKKIIFQENMGTINDKVNRIIKISTYLTEILNLDNHKENILRTCLLCKSDLTTNIVNEFPDLEGIIGEVYALNNNEPEPVCIGIREHYMPRFAGDNSPESITGSIVSIADKIDSIVCSYQNNQIPTSSQDPLGIRRCMLGIIKIIIHHKYKINLNNLIDFTFDLISKTHNNKEKLIDFFVSRSKIFFNDYFKEYQNNNLHLIIECIKNTILADPYSSILMTEEFIKFSMNKEFKSFIETSNRVSNLAKKSEQTDININLFEKEIEKTLWNSLSIKKENIYTLLKTQNFSKVFEELSSMTEPISTYFEDVHVMTENDSIKSNRLAFLNELNTLYNTVADFSSFK